MTGEKFVNRDGIDFHKMTVYDRADVLRSVKARRRRQLLDDLKEVGAEKGEMLAELQAFDTQVPSEDDFVSYVNTPEGKADVILRALRKADAAKAQEIFDGLTLDAGQALDLVAELCGLRLTEPAKDADAHTSYGDGGAPNPPTPAEADSYSPTPATT